MNKRYMNEHELEATIVSLVKRKERLKLYGREFCFINRVLNGLRNKYEQAGPIWEEHDPYGWGGSTEVD
jgi:hypothetical protein